MNPKRIQRKRAKGWRMGSAIYVGRPTIFSNPFSARACGGPQQAVSMYRLYLRRRWNDLEERGCNIFAIMELQICHQELWRRLPELRGKALCCWCRLDAPCHADVLLEIANK